MADTVARRRPGWLTAPVLAVAVLSVGAGIGQFSVTALIGDVATAFGEPGAGEGLTAQIGLPTTTIGVALALIRVASLASMPAAALADRYGRRRLLLTLSAGGLTLTALAAGSPGFWWYVALLALARPMLSSVNALAGVVAAEEASTRDRSAALALIAASYGIGAGAVSLARAALPSDSFRLVTALALLPLLALPLVARRMREPAIASTAAREEGIPGAVPAGLRGRVAVLAGGAGVLAIATGPGFTFLFVYGEDVLGAGPGFTSLLVIGAGPVGLLGILLGRFGADRIGRRATASVMMALAGLSVTLAYSGSATALAVGYLAAIAFSTGWAPPSGALAAELVPTSVRATVAGWMAMTGVFGAVLGLLSFGTLAELTGGFAAASRIVGIGVAAVAGIYLLLPETRGHELDEDEFVHPAR